ncbi:hypothetical protein LIT25_16280 [Bacillus sp. F19]|nr:hypothetical protein LIT25_16280 [Bacillus sp. F19]
MLVKLSGDFIIHSEFDHPQSILEVLRTLNDYSSIKIVKKNQRLISKKNNDMTIRELKEIIADKDESLTIRNANRTETGFITGRLRPVKNIAWQQWIDEDTEEVDEFYIII